jgi:OmpA-OmpF porin, OOP family
MKRALLALGILLLATCPAAAQQDEEGCKDHPLFARMAGFHISGCEDEDPSYFEFDVPRGGSQKVDGHYWKIDYWLKDNARQPTTAQIIRNYWNLVAAKGGVKVLEEVTPAEATLTAKLPGAKGAGAIWLQVHATMEGEVYSLALVQEK